VTAYERSPHVEQQLYSDGFPSASDNDLMSAFHTVPWEERPAIAEQFEDAKFRRIARRLIFFERPDLLSQAARQAMSDEIARRLLGTSKLPGPWLTIPAAIMALNELLPSADAEAEALLLGYRAHLQELETRLGVLA
jgi:exodeoxyribonuclease I